MYGSYAKGSGIQRTTSISFITTKTKKTMETLRDQFEALVHKAQLEITAKAPFDLQEKFKGEYENEDDLLFDLPYINFSDSNGDLRIHAVITGVDEKGNVLCKATGHEWGEDYTATFDDVPAHSLFFLHELLSQ